MISFHFHEPKNNIQNGSGSKGMQTSIPYTPLLRGMEVEVLVKSKIKPEHTEETR